MEQPMTALTSPAFDNAIRNPANDAHFMVIKDVSRRIRVYRGDTLIADTRSALRVIEFGKSVYDPVVYVPAADLKVTFQTVEKSTHCPIKGDAGYVSLAEEEIGWIYRDPIDFARRLTGHYAFWPDKVRIVEGD